MPSEDVRRVKYVTMLWRIIKVGELCVAVVVIYLYIIKNYFNVYLIMLLCIIDTGIFAFITYKYELCSVFQLGFEKDRVQLADGGHFYVWTTMFSLT